MIVRANVKDAKTVANLDFAPFASLLATKRPLLATKAREVFVS